MIALTAESQPVAKQQRNDEAVRVGSDVVRQARIVAAAKGVSLGQYLTEMLRAGVADDYRRLAETMAAEIKPSKSPKPPKQ